MCARFPVHEYFIAGLRYFVQFPNSILPGNLSTTCQQFAHCVNGDVNHTCPIEHSLKKAMFKTARNELVDCCCFCESLNYNQTIAKKRLQQERKNKRGFFFMFDKREYGALKKEYSDLGKCAQPAKVEK